MKTTSNTPSPLSVSERAARIRAALNMRENNASGVPTRVYVPKNKDSDH